MLQRMRELSVQAATGTNAAGDITNLNLEFNALGKSIDSIVANTQWNGMKVLDGTGGTAGSFAFQVGANATQTLPVNFGNAATGGSKIAAATALTTSVGSIAAVDDALGEVATQRATYGAAINSLEHTVDNLTNVSQNSAASRSRIQDADYAAETTELARTQIIQQAGTAMLSQANQQAQSVLALLK
jgi:flagellin